MDNVVKLPNGGCMYSHEEIKVACDVYRKILSDRAEAEKTATDYAQIMWSQLPVYKRFWYQLKSGIFHSKEWWKFYDDKYLEGMSRWKGVGNKISCFRDYIWQGMKANDLIRMEMSGRNCYLNPDQIEVLEILTSLKGRLEEV